MPNSLRSTLQISPTVQRARSASRIGGRRFAAARAVSRTCSSAASASSAFRSARTRAVRSSCRRSASGSRRCNSISSESASAYLLTPTITFSPASTCCVYANAACSISLWTKPCSTAATAPPSSSTRSISSRARCSSSFVNSSMKYAPPSGSAVSVPPPSWATIGCLALGDPVRQGEGELLNRRRPCLADVVAGDRDRVPARHALGAVGEQVGRQPHRGPRREDVVPARDVLLEDVVLDGAAEALARDALLFADELVEEQQQSGRRVDRHGGRDLAERDPVEEQLHVAERVDRDACAPDLADGALVVGVVAELGRQVEGDGEPVLAPLEQVAEARVRLLGRGEARVLADRPGPAAVHVRVGTARVRELARQLELETRDVLLGVDRFDLDPGVGLAAVFSGRHRDRKSTRLN